MEEGAEGIDDDDDGNAVEDDEASTVPELSSWARGEGGIGDNDRGWEK